MNSFKKRNYQSGITIIELLITIAVIGAIATITIAAIDPIKQIKKGRDAKRKAHIAQIQQALELYRSDRGEYPASPLPSCPNGDLMSGGVYYLRKIPCDPVGSGVNYIYTPSAAPRLSYTLRACLENLTDSEGEGAVTNCPTNRTAYTRYSP